MKSCYKRLTKLTSKETSWMLSYWLLNALFQDIEAVGQLVFTCNVQIGVGTFWTDRKWVGSPVGRVLSHIHVVLDFVVVISFVHRVSYVVGKIFQGINEKNLFVDILELNTLDKLEFVISQLIAFLHHKSDFSKYRWKIF